MLLARCDKAAQKGGKKKAPDRAGEHAAQPRERTSALSGALDRLAPAGGGVECVAVRAGALKPNALAQSVCETVGAGRTDGGYRPVGPCDGYACQLVMCSVYGNRAPFHSCWVFEGSLFIRVCARVWFSGGLGTEGVMQGEQVSVSVQPFVCPLPEASRLPETAGLSVAYGRD